eukprot:12319375-Alexandrium_andersonii.AAC.2
MTELSRTLWERSRADPENFFRARQPAFTRAVMEYLEANCYLRVIYAPLWASTHTANVLGLLGLRNGTAEGVNVDRLGQPRMRRDHHPALKEDPRGGWLWDLAQEGIEPHPGPRAHHWRPGGRHREFNHFRPSVAADTPERRASRARASPAALEAVGATQDQLDT